MTHDLDRMRPVLVFGRDQAAVLAVWRELWDLTLGGAALAVSGPLAGHGYASFHVHLGRAVWPELKTILDRVTWFQVQVTTSPPPAGNRG